MLVPAQCQGANLLRLVILTLGLSLILVVSQLSLATLAAGVVMAAQTLDIPTRLVLGGLNGVIIVVLLVRPDDLLGKQFKERV